MEHITPNVDEMLIKMREHLRMVLEETCRGHKMILSMELIQHVREEAIRILTMYGKEWYPQLAGDDVEYEVMVEQVTDKPDALTIRIRPYRKKYIFDLAITQESTEG